MGNKIYRIHIECGEWDSKSFLIVASSLDKAKAILKRDAGFDFDRSKTLDNMNVSNRTWEEIKLEGIVYQHRVCIG